MKLALSTQIVKAIVERDLEGNESTRSRLLALLQFSHSVLHMICPTPTIGPTADTHIFLGSNLLSLLSKFAISIQAELDQLEPSDSRDAMVEAWGHACQLLIRLQTEEQKTPNPEIDRAFLLLYLLSGTLWHCLASESKRIILVTDVPRVPSIPNLLASCGWGSQPDESCFAAAQRIARAVKYCLRN